MTWDANESETEKTDTLNFDKFKFNYEVQKTSSEIKRKKMENEETDIELENCFQT